MDKSLPPVDTPNDFDIYEDVEYQLYWQSAARRRLDELEKAIVQELLPGNGRAVIDIGCGYGRLFPCYADRFEHIVLFDGSETLLQQALRTFGEKAFYVLGDVAHLPFQPAVFDAVLLVRVFHHLNQPEDALHSIHRIVCGHGSLIMNYSNKRNALQVIKYLLGRTNHNPFTPEPLTVEANFFHHHPASVSQLLTGLGFQRMICRGAGVMDKLTPLFGKMGRYVPGDMHIAPFLGRTALSPWIFCKAENSDTTPQTKIEGILDMLACPGCTGRLIQKNADLYCEHCSRMYPFHSGIIDMRLV